LARLDEVHFDLFLVRPLVQSAPVQFWLLIDLNHARPVALVPSNKKTKENILSLQLFCTLPD
jgi:hypothetical protein